MDLRFSEDDEAFRLAVRAWLEDMLSGEFAIVRGRGGPGDEHALYEERLAWERAMGEAGWTCLAWPRQHGGQDLSLNRQVIFHEEYARVGGPGRLGHIGEGLAGPTIIAFGTQDQKERLLPGIRSGTELWCQGYSEPDAGSDLANVSTFARLDGDEWVVNGQKVWTSLAHWASWCFVVCRTDREATPKHRGITYLLVPMDQPGITIHPIVQITGTSEFNEVFFDDARTHDQNRVGDVNDGWKVAMGTLAFERGASPLGQQMQFQNELNAVIELARVNGSIDNPVVRQRLADAVIGLRIMRYNTLRVLSNYETQLSRESMITKLYWATWHQKLGELYVDVAGPLGQLGEDTGGPKDYELGILQRMYLFTRSDTIYAGSNEIQRSIIGERALGLHREPR